MIAPAIKNKPVIIVNINVLNSVIVSPYSLNVPSVTKSPASPAPSLSLLLSGSSSSVGGISTGSSVGSSSISSSIGSSSFSSISTHTPFRISYPLLHGLHVPSASFSSFSPHSFSSAFLQVPFTFSYPLLHKHVTPSAPNSSLVPHFFLAELAS